MTNPAFVLALVIAGFVLTVAIVVGLIALVIWLVIKAIGCVLGFLGAVLSGSVVAIIVLVLIVLACIGLAELLVGRLRFYRFGVEEALAVAAVFLLSFSAAALVSESQYGLFRAASWIAGLLVGTASGFGIYRRFGFVYAAIGEGTRIGQSQVRAEERGILGVLQDIRDLGGCRGVHVTSLGQQFRGGGISQRQRLGHPV